MHEQIENLLFQVVKNSASDLHISVGHHPTLRIDGTLIPLAKEPVITPKNAEDLVGALLSDHQKERFHEEKELDFSYSFYDRARFRVNVFTERGFASAALRLIPAKIRTVEELNLPPILNAFAGQQQGFLLVVGPTGHGKSTTLAAIVDSVNHLRTDHILTIEDPIEYLFTSDRSIINQREMGIDSHTFRRALRSMFREDVDVVMIGEMRDAETISLAVTAAETGHFVLSTLHTNNAAQSIDRIIDSFPAGQQDQIRAQLAQTLMGIVSQRLLPRLSGGLIPATEVLVANAAVRNLIREKKTNELNLVIETSLDHGMISLNRSLADLVHRGEITLENALTYSLNPDELHALIG